MWGHRPRAPGSGAGLLVSGSRPSARQGAKAGKGLCKAPTACHATSPRSGLPPCVCLGLRDGPVSVWLLSEGGAWGRPPHASAGHAPPQHSVWGTLPRSDARPSRWGCGVLPAPAPAHLPQLGLARAHLGHLTRRCRGEDGPHCLPTRLALASLPRFCP